MLVDGNVNKNGYLLEDERETAKGKSDYLHADQVKVKFLTRRHDILTLDVNREFTVQHQYARIYVKGEPKIMTMPTKLSYLVSRISIATWVVL